MAELHELIEKIENPELRAQIAEAAKRALKHKQFGLVFEEHLPECTPLYDIPVRKGLKVSVRNGKANETYTVLKIENDVATCLPKNSKEAVQFAVTDLVTTAELGDPIYPCLQPLGEVCNAPDSELWHTLIEADNYHALQLLEYLYAGKVDCIYIDPPYNTGAKDWKYNNHYVDSVDEYRHSKWLSFMQKRLQIAKKLLNPRASALIITIDEKEYLHLYHLQSGTIKAIENGEMDVFGKNDDGTLIVGTLEKPKRPVSMWVQTSHDARVHGSMLLNSYFPDIRFSYPKSLYAVKDAIKFIVRDNPTALVVDFFSGSGTTLHAVNLLNAEDGGNRRCIMVTNNEVSAEERKGFEARGIQQGDPEWEARGIARYVTWPRTVCSIEGHDVNGNPLKGNYIGSDIPMADGFKANAAFFKLGFLDKTKVSLGMQFKELLSTLWMKAGAIGKCPVIDASVPDMLILPDNKMAILNDENQFGEFAEQLTQHPEIEVVYLVTDYESSFVAMTQALEDKKTYQLYRDYLDNFRINAGRNSR